MGRAAVAITLSASERRELDGLARRRKKAQGLARRARIVLAAADGLENKAIVEQVFADANTVGKWRRRFAEHRLNGLYDEPRSGAPRTIDDQRIAEIIGRTLEETPPDGTHWSLRSMARAVGYAPSTIPPDLAGLRTAAASQRDVQAVCGPAVCGEGARHRRAVSGPSGAGPGAVRGRKEPDPGVGPLPSSSPHAARTSRATHP